MGYLLGTHDHKGEEREHVELLGGTTAGETLEELAQEYAAVADLRPGLGKNTVHMSINFHPEERELEPHIHLAICEHWAKGMGFEVWTAVNHGDHNHICASRIQLDGSVVSDSHDFKRSEKLIREIEEKFDLIRVDASHLLEPDRAIEHGPAVKMMDIMRADQGEISIKFQLANLLDRAMEDKPTATEFAERVQDAGVDIRPALVDGELKGFSYGVGEFIFTSETLGRSFAFQNLEKRGLDYDQDRDFQRLSEIRDVSVEQADVTAVIDQGAIHEERADGDIGAEWQADQSFEDGNSGAEAIAAVEATDPGQAGDGNHSNQSRANSSGGGGGGGSSSDVGDAIFLEGDDWEAVSRFMKKWARNYEKYLNQQYADQKAMAAAALQYVKSLSKDLFTGARRSRPGYHRVMATAGAGRYRKRLGEIRKQLSTLACRGYEVVVEHSSDPKKNIGPIGVRPEQVIKMHDQLAEKNAQGFNVKVRPAPMIDKYGREWCEPYLFVDRLSAVELGRLRDAGLHLSVTANHKKAEAQGWIRISDRMMTSDEMRVVRAIVLKRYNVKTTDYGYLAGYTNRSDKPNEKGHYRYVSMNVKDEQHAPAPGGQFVVAEARELIEQERLRREELKRQKGKKDKDDGFDVDWNAPAPRPPSVR